MFHGAALFVKPQWVIRPSPALIDTWTEVVGTRGVHEGYFQALNARDVKLTRQILRGQR